MNSKGQKKKRVPLNTSTLPKKEMAKKDKSFRRTKSQVQCAPCNVATTGKRKGGEPTLTAKMHRQRPHQSRNRIMSSYRGTMSTTDLVRKDENQGKMNREII